MTISTGADGGCETVLIFPNHRPPAIDSHAGTQRTTPRVPIGVIEYECRLALLHFKRTPTPVVCPICIIGLCYSKQKSRIPTREWAKRTVALSAELLSYMVQGSAKILLFVVEQNVTLFKAKHTETHEKYNSSNRLPTQ